MSIIRRWSSQRAHFIMIQSVAETFICFVETELHKCAVSFGASNTTACVKKYGSVKRIVRELPAVYPWRHRLSCRENI
jgi:hypothetical protein